MKQIRVLFIMAMALWASALSAQSHWQCDYAKFSESMAVYFQISDGDNVIADVTPYEVAAFVGEECRGVAKFTEEEIGGNTVKYGYLRIYSDAATTEKISLKVYNKSTLLEKRIAGASFKFEKDQRSGVPSSPVKYDITASVPKYQLTVTPQDAEMGTAEGSGTFEEDDIAHIQASPKTGYHFVKWSDEDTTSMRTIVITEKTDLKAIFAPDQHQLTFISEGDTVRSALQDYNSTIIPPENPTKEGYSFVKWNPAIATKMPNNPLTYEAQFKINEYTMTFVVDGKTVREAPLEYGKAIPVPVSPSKTGFTFAGWDPAVPATVPGRNVTFTAQWTRNKYLATFIAEGDTVKNDSVSYEAAIVKPADPVKTGYTFTGWTPEIPEAMATENLTFTAQFTINQYQVTFTANGETIKSEKQDYATAIVAPEAPAKEGHTFQGWDPELTANTIVPDHDVTYNAVYTVNNYKLTWTIDEEKKDTVIAYGATIVKPADPVKKGYTFTGWTPEIPETMPASDLTFTAQFTINQYQVTFTANGETIKSEKQDYATAIVAPEAPAKEGHTFQGWDPELTANAIVPDHDVTYNAVYTVNNYKLTWTVDEEKKDTVIAYGATIVKPADPVKKGYTFTGWTPEIPETMPASDLTFTAQFTINQYQVTFTANGETIKSEKQDYATAIVAPEAPAKEGHTFQGWDPELTANATVPDHDVTYNAVYTVNSYYVIYIVDGKEWARDQVVYGTPISLREYTPSEDFTFQGWISDQEYTTMPAHDVTYTANLTSGIEKLFANNDYVDVYTVSGKLVARHITQKQIQKLPRGMYIINHKKVFVK